jgi:hypothetical protein
MPTNETDNFACDKVVYQATNFKIPSRISSGILKDGKGCIGCGERYADMQRARASVVRAVTQRLYLATYINLYPPYSWE